MAYAVLEEILNGDSDDESTNNTADQEKGEESTDAIEELKSAWIILVVAFTIPLVGLVYYFKEAWAQRRRLRDLESRSDTINRSGAQRN